VGVSRRTRHCLESKLRRHPLKIFFQHIGQLPSPSLLPGESSPEIAHATAGSIYAARAGCVKTEHSYENAFFADYLARIVLVTTFAQSMKAWATGLKVRFFSLMIATGRGSTGNFTGRILTGQPPPPNRRTEPGSRATKRPVATNCNDR
jgi:hypothetical protein